VSDKHCVEEREVRGYRVRVVYDENPMSPREWDNVGVMVCWHKRYTLGDEQPKQEPRDWMFDNAGKGYIFLPIYAYDHSGITISTGSFSCPWDSGQVGWIYATRESVCNALGIKRYRPARHKAKIEAILNQEVETYDQYLRGRVYGYVVDKAETCDKGHTHYTVVDSCYGFFCEVDEVMQEALASVPEVVECKG
jgi:hypothetical protein